jgi:hypothetical protein
MSLNTSGFNILSTSDLSSAIVGAGFASTYGLGEPMMYGVRSLIVSMIARMISQSTAFSNAVPNMSESGKSQIIVAILGAAASYYKKSNPMKRAVSQSAIDFIGLEVLKTIGMDDTIIIGGSS